MQNILISILETCFLNCSCLSVSCMIDKFNQLTHNRYNVTCIESSMNMLKFLIDNVIIVMSLNDHRVINKITCAEYKKCA